MEMNNESDGVIVNCNISHLREIHIWYYNTSRNNTGYYNYY